MNSHDYKTYKTTLLRVGCLAWLTATLTSPIVQAQGMLEEVVVTATKRTTTVKEVPMAIQAITGETMTRNGIDNLDQLAASIPNFQVGDGLLSTAVAMRGMSSQPERGFDQSVGMFIDGIYKPRSRQYRSPFMDVSRVEILRGPQAVLFGLNSTAGAVSIISNSNQPGDDFEAEIRAKYEIEYEGATVEGFAGGSVNDQLGLRFAGKYRNDGEGQTENAFDGRDYGDPEELVLRGSAVWVPVEGTTFTLKVDYADFEADGNPGEEMSPQLFGGLNGNFEAKLDHKNNWEDNVGYSLMNARGHVERDTAGIDQESVNISLNVEQEFGGSTLTAMLGYSDMEYNLSQDGDTGPLFFIVSAYHEEYEQTSLEVRWTSPVGETFEWIAGAYYQDSELINLQPNVVGGAYDSFFGFGFAPDAPMTYLTGEMGSDTTSVSAFGILSWNISDVLKVTGGLRWVDTETDYFRGDSGCTTLDPALLPQATLDAFSAFFFCFTAPNYQDERSSDNFMPELAVQWDATDELMLYGKVSKSAKAGGFGFSVLINSDANGNPLAEFDDEKALGFELGAKYQTDTHEFSITGFHTKFEDLQVNSFDPVTFIGSIQNAAEVVSKGVEVEGRWAATDWLMLSGALTYLDSEFEEFDGAPCGALGNHPASTAIPGSCDLSGVTTAYAPEVAGSLNADLSIPLAKGLNLVGGVSLSYSDDYFTDSDLTREFKQDSYTLVDARIGVEAQDGKWSVSLIGNNISDEIIINQTSLYFTQNAFLKSARTVALQATYRFGR